MHKLVSQCLLIALCLFFLGVNVHVIRREWGSKTVRYEAVPAEKEQKHRSPKPVLPYEATAEKKQKQLDHNPVMRYEPAGQKNQQQQQK